MSIPKKSRTKGELIPAVIIEFRNWPNLYATRDEYESWGGYQSVLKDFEVPVGEIKKGSPFTAEP